MPYVADHLPLDYLYDRILAVRAGGNVRRFHIEPTLGEQTNATHQWHAALLLLALHPHPSPALLRAVLVHDVHEGVLGDVPAPCKRGYPSINAALVTAQQDVDRQLSLTEELTRDEQDWLHTVDYLEAAFFALEQRQLGNVCFERIFDACITYICTRTTPPARVQTVIRHLRQSMSQIRSTTEAIYV